MEGYNIPWKLLQQIRDEDKKRMFWEAAGKAVDHHAYNLDFSVGGSAENLAYIYAIQNAPWNRRRLGADGYYHFYGILPLPNATLDPEHEFAPLPLHLLSAPMELTF
jgi:hypothetical protein